MPRLLALVPILLLAGCLGGRPAGEVSPAGALATGEARATLAEVDQQCFAFADRYAAGIASAIERMVAEEPDPLRRRDLRRLRVEAIGGVYDVATGADPFAKLLDLVLVTTLQSRVWIDELEGERQFGPRGALLADAIRRQRVEIWRIAGDALTPEQLQELDGLITAWRRANPAVRAVSFVRFDEAGAARGRALAAAVESGDGLLAPVDRAAGIADRTRALGERMFWLGKRLPFLLQWQMELSVDELLLRPDLAGLAATVNGMPALIERERTALLAELDRAGGEARGLMAEARRTIDTAAPLLADVRAATASLDQTVAGVNRLAPLFVPVPGAAGAGTASGAADKPFDIRLYAAALTEARHTLEELNRLVGSSAVPNHIRDLNKTAAERVEQASERAASMMRLAFLYAAALVVLLLAAAMTYRWWSARLRRQEPR